MGGGGGGGGGGRALPRLEFRRRRYPPRDPRPLSSNVPTFTLRRRRRRLNKETDLSLFINKILTRNNERVGDA